MPIFLLLSAIGENGWIRMQNNKKKSPISEGRCTTKKKRKERKKINKN